MEKKKPTMLDLAKDLEKAKEDLIKANVGVTKVFVWLPDEYGCVTKQGPMPAEEAARRIRDAYSIY